MSERQVVVVEGAQDVAREAAERLTALARDAVGARGRFTVALSGGSTPRALFQLLAREPYRSAIDFYNSRAVSGAFRWNWTDARLEQDVFRAEIASSDEAFRSATNYLGIVVLNHIGSAVDTLITQRLRGRGGSPSVIPRVGQDGGSAGLRLSWHARF